MGTVIIDNPLTIIKQSAEAAGKKFTTGTMVLTQETGQPVITHNLGSIPSVFFMIAKNVQGEFTFNAENQPTNGIYGYFRDNYRPNTKSYFVGGDVKNYGGLGMSLEWRNNNTTSLSWQANGITPDRLPEPTDTQIQLSYRSAAYSYLANQEYEWIAIE